MTWTQRGIAHCSMQRVVFQITMVEIRMKDTKREYRKFFSICLLVCFTKWSSTGGGMPHYCYLLRSLNEKYKNSTYIGYTVNPMRRIRQHNREVSKDESWVMNRLRMELSRLIAPCLGKWFVSFADFQTREKVCDLNGLVGYYKIFDSLGQHPVHSKICREFISTTLERRRKYISKLEIALRMVADVLLLWHSYLILLGVKWIFPW